MVRYLQILLRYCDISINNTRGLIYSVSMSCFKPAHRAISPRPPLLSHVCYKVFPTWRNMNYSNYGFVMRIGKYSINILRIPITV